MAHLKPPFQLPPYSGQTDGKQFEAVVQAPPIGRVDIVLGPGWDYSAGEDPNLIAQSMINQYAGRLNQFFRAQSHNYNIGAVEYAGTMMQEPGITARYSAVQGTEMLMLEVSPTTQGTRPSLIVDLSGTFIVEGDFNGYPIFGQGARMKGMVVSWVSQPIAQQTPWSAVYAPLSDESNNISYVVNNGGYAFDPLFKNETPGAPVHTMLPTGNLWGAISGKGYLNFVALGDDGMPDIGNSPSSGGVPINWALDHVGASGILPQSITGKSYFEVEIMALPGDPGVPDSQVAVVSGNRDAGTYIKTEEVNITTTTLTLNFLPNLDHYQSPAIGLASVDYIPTNPDTGRLVSKPTQVWGVVLGLDPDPASTNGRSVYTLPTQIEYNAGISVRQFFPGSYWWQNPHHFNTNSPTATGDDAYYSWTLTSAPSVLNPTSPVIWTENPPIIDDFFTGNWIGAAVGDDDYMLVTTIPTLYDLNTQITNPDWLLQLTDENNFSIGVGGQYVIGSIADNSLAYSISGPDIGSVGSAFTNAVTLDTQYMITYQQNYADGDGGNSSYTRYQQTATLTSTTIYEGSYTVGGVQAGDHLISIHAITNPIPPNSSSKSQQEITLTWPPGQYAHYGYMFWLAGPRQVSFINSSYQTILVGPPQVFAGWCMVGEVGGPSYTFFTDIAGNLVYQSPGYQGASITSPSTLLGDIYPYNGFNLPDYANSVGVVGPTPFSPARITYGYATKILEESSGGANRLGDHTWVYKGRADLLGNGDTPKQDITSEDASVGVWTGVDLGDFNVGDIVQIAVDTKTRKVWFGKNNLWYGQTGSYKLGHGDTLDKHDAVTYLDGDTDTKYYPACAFRVGHTKMRMRWGNSIKYFAPPGFTAYDLETVTIPQ